MILWRIRNWGRNLLMLVAFCFALCLVPLALTHKIHPGAAPGAASNRAFIRRVAADHRIGLGASGRLLHGLAPLYANQLGLPNEQVGLYMGACIFAGLLVQWPLGWLSDRRDRAWLIRACAILLCLFALPLALLQQMPLALLLALGIAASMLQFTLYPLAVAFSNDHVETERRVSLTAMLLVTFGVGAASGRWRPAR